jgi:molecular chaperone GrpE
MATKTSTLSKNLPKSKPEYGRKSANLDTRLLELQDRLARSLADYSNLEKRIENQRQLFVTLATVSIISRMVDVLDDLYLIQDHLHDQGLQMTIDKFVTVLKAEGLDEINADNTIFDPSQMECTATAEGKENVVISVKKKGYTLNGQVIRPAQVIVGKKF